MPLPTRQIYILTRLTAAETVRQPVFLLLTMCCAVLTLAVPLTTANALGDAGRLAVDSGLAFQFMFGLFLGGYAACGALGRERQSGTAAAILSKPVSRGVYFLSKFLGIGLVIALFSCCAGLATLLADRIAEHYSVKYNYLVDYQTACLSMLCPALACVFGAWANYASKRSFQSTAMVALPVLLAVTAAAAGCFTRAGEWQPYTPHFRGAVAQASLLVTLGLIALALAVRLTLMPTVCICMAILMLGLAADYAFGRGAPHSWWLNALYAFTPNWQHFWVADLVTHGAVPWSYFGRAILYSTLYTTGILCLGTVTFGRSEAS